MTRLYLVMAIAALGMKRPCLADDWPMEGKTPLHRAISADAVTPPLEPAWTFDTGDSITASPVVKYGMVYAGAYDGSFYAVNAQTGKKVWEFKTGEDLMFWAPAAAGDGVVAAGGCDGIIYGRDARTGESLWEVRTQGVISGGGTIADGTLYVGSMDHNMYALDLKTGKEKWRYFANWYFLSAPVVDAERRILYTNAHDHMGYAIDIRNGKLLWKTRVSMQGGFPNNGPPSLEGGRLFMAVHPANFRCFRAADGKALWSVDSGANFPGCVVLGNKVITGTRSGLSAYNIDDGRVIWAFEENAYVSRCTPAASGKVVYFCSRNGKVYGLDMETGQKIWEYETGGPIDGSPAVADGRLYITSTDGKLYCFTTKR